MTDYANLVQIHASKVYGIYKVKMPEIMRLSGLTIAPDGSNNAGRPEDVVKYLKALKETCGNVSYVSARLIIFAEARRKNITLEEIAR